MLGYENHSFPYRILRVSDKWVIINRNVKLYENAFPDLTPLPTQKPPNAQNLPYHHSSVNENSSDESDDFSLLEEELHDKLEEQPTQRIRVIGPRHPTLITRDISSKNILPYRRRAHKEIKLKIQKSYQEAINSLKCKKWKEEISKELDKMIKLKVWKIRDHPITSTWVFKVKKDDQQQITKEKERLCAQGFHQIQGLD
ncbi:hypothetical protein O181_000652 [Austropuccinia psidii MF-1]|uniref:Reverse transcriptase Ty1/copia-type domain-containing protein n=1 Tax=Austropuccinia psidii MF-1 TaxID=1389203 RepID=A0A9Q3B9A8_9BASI|nr:hypothetical protein [Austropuccinia psidii MF-1]